MIEHQKTIPNNFLETPVKGGGDVCDSRKKFHEKLMRIANGSGEGLFPEDFQGENPVMLEDLYKTMDLLEEGISEVHEAMRICELDPVLRDQIQRIFSLYKEEHQGASDQQAFDFITDELRIDMSAAKRANIKLSAGNIVYYLSDIESKLLRSVEKKQIKKFLSEIAQEMSQREGFESFVSEDLRLSFSGKKVVLHYDYSKALIPEDIRKRIYEFMDGKEYFKDFEINSKARILLN